MFGRHTVRCPNGVIGRILTNLVRPAVACEKFHKVLDSAPKMDPERTPKPRTGSDRTPLASSLSKAGATAGIGFQFALSVLLFLWLGQWIDARLGTEPWFLLIGVFVGAGASFYSFYRKLMQQQRREDEERRRQ